MDFVAVDLGWTRVCVRVSVGFLSVVWEGFPAVREICAAASSSSNSDIRSKGAETRLDAIYSLWRKYLVCPNHCRGRVG